MIMRDGNEESQEELFIRGWGMGFEPEYQNYQVLTHRKNPVIELTFDTPKPKEGEVKETESFHYGSQ